MASPEVPTNDDVLDEVLRWSSVTAAGGDGPGPPGERLDADELVAAIHHRELLEQLLAGPLYRDEIQERLAVSRATSHRFVRWIQDAGLARRVEGRYELTGTGRAYAGSLRRFERDLRTATVLAPLLDAVLDVRPEFPVLAFVGATVTTPLAGDPHRALGRFVALVRESSTFRGFNTTHVVPAALAGADGDPFEDTDVQLIYLSAVLDGMAASYPGHLEWAVDGGHLAVESGELPYGVALFDDRVAVAGYDADTGTLRVLVDTDADLARAWAERAYGTYLAEATPIDGRQSG